MIPALVAATGRLPGWLFGGETLPPAVGREWARWGRDREYVVGFARGRGASGFDSFRGDLLAYAITDDPYAPRSTVAPLVEAFTAARTELLTVAPERCGLTALGHFGPFRAPCRRRAGGDRRRRLSDDEPWASS